MNKLQLQFKVYMKTFKLLLKIILAVYLINIVFGGIIGVVYLHNYNIYSSAPVLLLNFFLGLLVAIPVVNVKMMPFFMNFGMKRKKYYINMCAFNVLMCLAMSLLMTLVYFTQDLLLPSSTISFFMGFASIDHRYSTILLFVMVNFGIFNAIVSLISFVCAIFCTKGIVYGISSVLLALSIPMFFLRGIYDFFEWGGPALVIGAALIVFGAGTSLLAWRFVSRLEISN